MLYRPRLNDFRFVRSREPVMDADRTCLIATQNITYMMREAVRDLCEPLRFGRALARRVMEADESPRVKSLLTFNKSDYREICLKLERLMNDVMRQRDMWKERFFFRAINADEDDLCGTCKEEMRQAFYVNGDEEEALKWRPGKGKCFWRNCEHFSWESFEDEYDEEYLKDVKNMEITDEVYTQ